MVENFGPAPVQTDGEAKNPGPHVERKRRWTVASVNPTSWTSALPLVARQEYDAIGFQEIMRDTERTAYAEVEANRAGHHASFNHSLRTGAGGQSAGVALISAWAYGLTEPSIPDVVTRPEPSRFLFKHFHGIATGGVGLGTVYLKDGVGSNDSNNYHIMQIAGYLRA